MTSPPGVEELLAKLRHDGLVTGAEATLTPLSGGVSSDIFRVDDGGRTFVVKQALKKLKVREDWFADESRNLHERAYLEYVVAFLPSAVPRILGGASGAGYFAMEYLGEGFANWKQLLLDGKCDPRHAELAAALMSEIHRRSAGDPAAARTFDTTENFRQLRIDPYLRSAAKRHPALQPVIEAEARRLETSRVCLVHGDFSPKNILIRDDRMVLLDCEVAWFGDPAFDVAFLLNHFFLKALHHAPADPGLAALIAAFWARYFETDADAALMERSTHLLLMLMLARVDGKSPAEYLNSGESKQFVRDFVYEHLQAAHFDLKALMRSWFSRLSISQ